MFKLIFTNAKGESVEMFGPPFRLIRFDGLGDVAAVNQTQRAPYQDGSTLINTVLEERYPEIELKITAGDEKELAAYRRRLSSVFNPRLGEGMLRRISADGEHILKAVAESVPFFPDGQGNRGRHFQKALVTLKCPNPYWRDEKTKKAEVAIWRGAFEFPLEIVSEGIEMGYREPSLIVNSYNPGDVACGMEIRFKALGTVENPSLFNMNTREFLKVNKTLTAGEILTVTTHFGNKRVEANLNGVISNAFNWLDLGSTFLQLQPGDNLFRYDAGEGLDNLEIDIYYNPQYVGV